VLNYSDLFEYLIYDKLFDKTPREKYNRFTSLKNVSWGSVYPKFTNLAVIGQSYRFFKPITHAVLVVDADLS
jgi:calcium permeable stress-gated cation channel